MKKAFLSLVLAIFVSSAAFAATDSAPAGNPVDQFTGKYWVESTVANKGAYLFGIDSAIAVEAMIARIQAERAKKDHQVATGPSPFVRNWMDAFRTTSRDEIITLVDDWYASHPDQLDRPVLDVIWHDIIMPRIRAMQR